MSPDGTISTYAGDGNSGYIDAVGASARFNRPFGIAVSTIGIVYVSDTYNHCIRKIATTQTVTTIAGQCQTSGTDDGDSTTAKFFEPGGLTLDQTETNLYIAGHSDQRIRKAVISTGVVSTYAGSSIGYVDGQGTAARFNHPFDVAFNSSGYLFVADKYNHLIRAISPSGYVSTFAGSSAGLLDGQGTAAKFNQLSGIVFDNHGNILVADSENQVIRKVSPSGTVTKIGNIRNLRGDQQGPAAKASFNYPRGVEVDANGTVYVGDESSQRILMICDIGLTCVNGVVDCFNYVCKCNEGWKGPTCAESVTTTTTTTTSTSTTTTTTTITTTNAITTSTSTTSTTTTSTISTSTISTGTISTSTISTSTISTSTIANTISTSAFSTSTSTGTISRSTSTSTIASTISTSAFSTSTSTGTISTSTISTSTISTSTISKGTISKSTIYTSPIFESTSTPTSATKLSTMDYLSSLRVTGTTLVAESTVQMATSTRIEQAASLSTILIVTTIVGGGLLLIASAVILFFYFTRRPYKSRQSYALTSTNFITNRPQPPILQPNFNIFYNTPSGYNVVSNRSFVENGGVSSLMKHKIYGQNAGFCSNGSILPVGNNEIYGKSGASMAGDMPMEQTQIMTQNVTTAPLFIPGYSSLRLGIDCTVPKEIDRLGKGGTASIVAGTLINPILIDKHGTMNIALKLFPINGNDEKAIKESFLYEVAIMNLIPVNPHIVNFVGFMETPQFVIVMKQYEGSLNGLIKEKLLANNPTLCCKISRDVSDGLRHIHSMNILHLDVKPLNILWERLQDGSFNFCICDFGFASIVGESRKIVSGLQIPTSVGVTVRYTAPEVFCRFAEPVLIGRVNNELDKKIDVYAFGISMYEVLMGDKYWSGLQYQQIIEKVQSGERPSITSLPPNISENANCKSLINVVTQCWMQNPSERPSFEDICNILNPSF